jgi:hypothetical protein
MSHNESTPFFIVSANSRPDARLLQQSASALGYTTLHTIGRYTALDGTLTPPEHGVAIFAYNNDERSKARAAAEKLAAVFCQESFLEVHSEGTARLVYSDASEQSIGTWTEVSKRPATDYTEILGRFFVAK